MQLKKGQIVELEIESLVFGGRGIGEFEGRKVFVPDTVPGDKVEAKLTRIKPKFMEARLERVVRPSERRVEARCPHFDVCGGCKWQFLPYEEQLRVKEQQVRDSLERIGGLDGTIVSEIIGNASPWFYRNKMEVSFGPGEDSLKLGFYPPGFHYEVFDLEECYLQSEMMPELVARVREWAVDMGLEFYKKDTGEGFLRNFIIREGKRTGERMVILVTSMHEFPEAESFVALFDESEVSSIFWMQVDQERGRRTEIHEHHLFGKRVLTEALELENGERLEFDIQPQAFFQTNTLQAEVLYSEVISLAELNGDEVVFDLYCGTGTIGLFCAHKAREVVGVELNPSAVASAKVNAAKNGIENVRFELGSVDSVLESLEGSPDVVIVDPPRAGLGETVVEQVCGFGARRVVYVSCNPTSMARDLKQFGELGYVCKKVQPVDMFPQTHHVECVCLLERT